MALVLIGTALLLSSGLLPRPGETDHRPAAAEPALVVHDLSDGDPPLDEQHRELPAKKPRLNNLLVQTSCASATAGPQGFHLHAAADTPDIRTAHGIASDASIPAHRADPALRLHPGQAPPHTA